MSRTDNVGGSQPQGSKPTSCFNVNRCAAAAANRSSSSTLPAKYAIVLTHSLEKPGMNGRFRPEQMWTYTAWQRKGIDTVMIVPGCSGFCDNGLNGQRCANCENTFGSAPYLGWAGTKPSSLRVYPLTPDERAFMAKHNVRIIEVPWVIPPGTSEKVGRDCGPKDLIRLHALKLTEYHAIMYVDMDVQIIGDIRPVLQCAASGEFMMTEGSGAPMNAGFMALKPEQRMFDLATWFAANADFSADKPVLHTLHGGWGGGSAWPALGTWPGFSCGQGFLWTLFYGNGFGVANATSKLVREAWAKFPDGVHKPRIVDRCIFNYQREAPKESGSTCAADFTCSDVINLHKGHADTDHVASIRSRWVEQFGDGIVACTKPKVHSGLPDGVE